MRGSGRNGPSQTVAQGGERAMKDDIDARLQSLRNAVDEARSVPMSASVMINRTEFNTMLDALEKTIDSTLSEASEVVDDREAVLASGTTQAEAIIRAAELERDRLVSDTDVFRNAERRAAEILEEATRAAEELQLETDQYVEEKLANFELTLEHMVDAIHKRPARHDGAHLQGLGDEDPPGEESQDVGERLTEFELTLERTIEVIRKGRARLSGGHVHGLGDDSDVAAMHLPDHLER